MYFYCYNNVLSKWLFIPSPRSPLYCVKSTRIYMSKLAYIWKLHPVRYRKEWIVAITSTFTLMQFSATYRTRISVGQCSYLMWSPEIDQYQRPSALGALRSLRIQQLVISLRLSTDYFLTWHFARTDVVHLLWSLVPYDRVGRCSRQLLTMHY